MESPIRGFLPARLGLLQAAAGRVDSVASTGPPGSTRTGQGTVVARSWLKLGAQGTLSYIQARGTADHS